jgi:hypothetical protein
MAQREQGEKWFKTKGNGKLETKTQDPSPMAAEEGSGGGGGCSGGDRKSSPAPTKPGGGGAAKFLAGMPSRGNFSSGSVSSSLVRILALKPQDGFLYSGVLRRLDSLG